jgi:ATP:ADP antiporter, AAA family
LNLSVRAVSILILLLISLWIYFAIRARKEYVLAFQRQLGIPTAEEEKKDHSEAAVAASLRRTLRLGSHEQILLALERIEESKDAVLMQEVIPLLTHESAKIRLAALSTLYYDTDHSITDAIAPRLKDPDDQVRARAFACLLAHTRQNRVRFIDEYLTDPDPAISGAALIGLATETRANPKLQLQFNLENRLREKLKQAEEYPSEEDAVDAKIVVIRAIGFGKITSFYPLLEEMMQDKNPAISRKAIIAAGNTGDLRFINKLISLLPKELTRTAAQKALAKFKPADVLPVITEISNKKDAPLELLIQLPALIQSMDTQQALDFLFGLLMQHNHPALKFEALEVLHTMKTKFPNLTITGKRIMPYLMEEAALYKDTLALNYSAQQGLNREHEDLEVSSARFALIELLEKKLDNDLKRIFWLLGLSYPPGIILPLYADLRKEDPEMRISTVELLDNILDPGLKKVVISIVESAMMEKLSSDDLGRLEVNIPTEISCYESILNGRDEELKAAVLRLLEAMKKPEFEHLVKTV